MTYYNVNGKFLYGCLQCDYEIGLNSGGPEKESKWTRAETDLA